LTVHDRPDALELVEAVTEFLGGEILPVVEDPRLRFRTLVALNALGIAYRELASDEPDALSGEELATLARRIRAGDVPNGAVARLKEHVAAKLRVSNPSYLEKYE
jgi:hypothetical protein